MWTWIIDVIFVRKQHWFTCMSLNFSLLPFSQEWNDRLQTSGNEISSFIFWKSLSSAGECCVTNDRPIINLVVLSGFYCDEIRKLIYNLPHVHHFTYDLFLFKYILYTKTHNTVMLIHQCGKVNSWYDTRY